MKIEGKHALVTGGAAGIGLAITHALTAAGASVLVVGRDRDKLERARVSGSGITTFAADLADPDARERLIARVRTGSPPLDILVS